MSEPRFHHGDLRAALLRLAATELETHGHEQLSLRKLAAMAGVSTAAPYKHFDSRADLIEALVEEGIAYLSERYSAASLADATPAERLRQACRAYLEFAAREPQRFRLIFVSDIFLTVPHRSADATYQLFEELVADVLGSVEYDKRVLATVACWSMIHGFAMLQINRRIPGGVDDASAADIIIDAAVASVSWTCARR